MQTQTNDETFSRVKDKLLKSKQFKEHYKVMKTYTNEKDIPSFDNHADNFATTFIRDVMPSLEGMPIYGQVLHVSKSGMSRTARFYYVKDSRIVCLNFWLKLILDQATDKDRYDLKLQGCGMDMLFDAVYRFGYAVKDDGYYYKSARL